MSPRLLVTSRADPMASTREVTRARLARDGITHVNQSETGAVHVGITPDRILLTGFLGGEFSVFRQ